MSLFCIKVFTEYEWILHVGHEIAVVEKGGTMSFRSIFHIGLFTLIFLFPRFVSAEPVVLWKTTIGGVDSDLAYSVQQTSDRHYIATGGTRSISHGEWDLFLAKVDNAGDTVWCANYGGTEQDFGFSVIQTSEGGYIAAGYSTDSGSSDIYLVKTDRDGALEWSRVIGDNIVDESGHSIQQTSDGGYIIAGEKLVESGYGDDYYQVYLLKTDSLGVETWDASFGGVENDWGRSVRQAEDGGFIVAGVTTSYGSGLNDVYLIKTDSTGTETWSATFGGTEIDAGNSVDLTVDGGYVIGGYTFSFGSGLSDAYIIKVDDSGNELWSETYGGTGTDYGFTVVQAPDGTCLLAGSTDSYGSGSTDAYIVKVDAAGNEMWDKVVGGVDDDAAHSIVQTMHGGYIIAGYSVSFGEGEEDMWLFKLSNEIFLSLDLMAVYPPAFSCGEKIEFELSYENSNEFDIAAELDITCGFSGSDEKIWQKKTGGFRFIQGKHSIRYSFIMPENTRSGVYSLDVSIVFKDTSRANKSIQLYVMP